MDPDDGQLLSSAVIKMFSRAGRASLLDRKAFTEAFFDGDAPADAAILVSLVAAAVYVGTLARLGALEAFSITDLFQVVIAGVVSWLVLGFATWFVANRLFGASSRPQTMIGIQGLAVLPLLLEIFGVGDRWARAGLVSRHPGGRDPGGDRSQTP